MSHKRNALGHTRAVNCTLGHVLSDKWNFSCNQINSYCAKKLLEKNFNSVELISHKSFLLLHPFIHKYWWSMCCWPRLYRALMVAEERVCWKETVVRSGSSGMIGKFPFNRVGVPCQAQYPCQSMAKWWKSGKCGKLFIELSIKHSHVETMLYFEMMSSYFLNVLLIK